MTGIIRVNFSKGGRSDCERFKFTVDPHVLEDGTPTQGVYHRDFATAAEVCELLNDSRNREYQRSIASEVAQAIDCDSEYPA